MALLPLQDPTPQLLGPRAYAQRRVKAMENVAQDPRKWFTKFLQQYGVKGSEGMATIANPRSAAEYQGAAKRLDRTAAEAAAMNKVYSGNTLYTPSNDPLGISDDPFLQMARGRLNDTLIDRSEQGARTLRLGAQVFGGGPGEFTDQYNMWNKAISQRQSLGGTFYSEAGAAQAAMGSSAFINQARSELAAPLDAATAMQTEGARVNDMFRRFSGEFTRWKEGPTREQQIYTGGTRRGQATTTRDPLRMDQRSPRPQSATGMIGRMGR